MTLLDQAAKQRIEQKIAELEQRSAAELVVVTVGRSDDYAQVRWAGALAAALLGAACAHVALPSLLPLWLLWLELACAALAYLLLGWRPLLALAVPRGLAARNVERRAQAAFLAHNVFATRDRTGVLILLSELERQVVILGDQGIHARVQVSGWQAHVATIVAAIRRGRAADGVCEVLDALAAALARDVPIREGDTNELPNTVSHSES
jgi:putative membrane protein